MGSLVEMGLANALFAGILALAALLAGRYSRRPALVHSLWILVLLKLVTPPLIPLPIPGWQVADSVRPVEPAPDPDASAGQFAHLVVQTFEEPMFLPPAGLKIEERLFDPNKKPMPPMPMPEMKRTELPANFPLAPEEIGDPVPPSRLERKPTSSFSAPTYQDLTTFIFVLWIGGSLVCLLWTIRRVWLFTVLLREARPASEELQAEANLLAQRLRLGRCPSVWLIPGPVPPLLWAVGGKARLYFPSSLLPRLPESGRAALLMHELAHLARRDHWVRWLELIVSVLYWWYPLVWLARHRLCEAEEECCDAWVTSELPDHRPAYAGALLQTVDFLSRSPGALPPAGSGFGRVHQMKRRLTMIVRGSTPRGLSLAGKLLILALLAVLPLLPSPGRTAAPPKSDKSQEKAAKQADSTDGHDEPGQYQNQNRTLQGDGGQVWQAAVSPDGKTLAVVSGGTGQNEGSLTLYDLPDGKERVALTASKPIRSVAFSPDGKHLATGDFDNLAYLRDPKTGSLRQVLRGHTGSVNSVAFTPDSKLLVTASLDKTLKVWQVSDGKETHTLKDHTDWVLHVSISRDGKTMLSTSRDKTARIWDLPKFTTRHVLKAHNDWVESGAISADGKSLATFAMNGIALVWDAATGKALREHHFPGALYAGMFLDGGKKLAVTCADHSVHLWDFETAQSTALATGHTANIYALTATPDAKTLVTGSWDNTVKLWDAETKEVKKTLQQKRYAELSNFPILAMACSPDGKTLAVSGEEKGVKLIDSENGSLRHLLEGHDDIVGGVAFSHDGKTLATAGFDEKVMLWDVATGKRKDVLSGHQSWVFSVSYSPDGKWLASAGYDRTVRIWDAKSGKFAFALTKHKGGVRCVAWSADSKQVATGGTDKSVRVWDLDKKEVIATLKGHEDVIRGLAFLPNGRRLVSASEDQTVRGWNIADEKQVGIYQHNDVIRGICLSPRGRSLAVVAQDRSIRLLDPMTLTQKLIQYNHSDAVTSAAFSPDARTLFSGSSDKTIRRIESAMEARAPLLTFRDSVNKQMWFASYSPDGKWLATGGADKALRVRPAMQGTKSLALEGLDQAVYSIAVSPDGSTVAAGLANNTIGLWDARSGKRKTTMGEAKQFPVWMIAFSPDGKKLATVSGSWNQVGEPGEAKLWDVGSGKTIGELPEHSSPVMALAWSKDGKRIVTGARDGSARIIDSSTLKQTRELKGHTDAARFAVFSPDDRFVATAGFDGTIRIWKVEDGKEVISLKGHEGGMNCVAWSSDGKMLAAVPRPGDRASVGEVHLWNVSLNGDVLAFEKLQNLKGHSSRLLACAFSPDGKSLATTGGNYNQFGETIVWDVATGKERMLLHGHRLWCEAMTFGKDGTLYTGGGTAGTRGELRAWQVNGEGWTVPDAFKGDLTCAAWSKDGKTLATGAGGGLIKVWDAATGKMKTELTGHKGMVRALAFSPDGKSLASGGSDNTVRLWDLDGDTEAIELAKFEQNVTSVAFSPDGTMLAAGSADPLYKIRTGDTKVFDVKTGKERPGAQWAKLGAMSVAFSPDGKLLATGASGTNMLRIYDAKSGKFLRAANGANSIRMIAWSPDGKRIAAAHGPGAPRGNGIIQIWDAVSGREVMALSGHTTLCLGLSYSPDGKRLASASNDTTVKVWDLTGAGLPALPRAMAVTPKQ